MVQIGAFVAVFLSVCLAVKMTYPDVPTVPREFEGGLERELGGRGAVRVSIARDSDLFAPKVANVTTIGKSPW